LVRPQHRGLEGSKTRGFRPPTATYSFAGPKEYAEKGPPLAWSMPAPVFRVINTGTAVDFGVLILTGAKRKPRAMSLQRQVTPRQCSSRFGKKPPCPRGPEEIRPPAFHAPGRVAVFFASFLFGGLKRKEGGGRGAAPAVLIGNVTFSQARNPGVSPPDGDILFCWPQRVCRKGPATGVEHACANF
jgi:hypothetical protein